MTETSDLTAAVGQSCFRPDEWQYEVSQRLQSLLTGAALRRLVGDFERSLRADRRAETGQDRPSHLHELADALLISGDVDVLARKDVRDALVKSVRARSQVTIDNPKRWVPGQAAARQFVAALGLPAEVAGVRSAERPHPFIRVAPPATYPKLEPYQEEMSQAMYERMNDIAPDNRAVISLPTGAGKTRVAVETLHRWAHDLLDEGARDRVIFVWLAHTEELCEQAMACFEEVWRANSDGKATLGLARFWGTYRRASNLDDWLATPATELPVITLVSTPQSFINEVFTEDLGISAIVIDEAHRAAAPTYHTIVQRYGEEAAVIGLTATPFRREFDPNNPLAGTEALRDIFHHLALCDSLGKDALARLQRLQEMAVLSRPVTRTVETRLTLSVDTPATVDDFSLSFNFDQELQAAADKTRRRRVVLDTVLGVLEETPSARILYFGPTVQDAELVAFMLRVKGKRAAAVSGTTRASTRRAIIADFRAGRIDVLCNCEVLTTGFDAPTVSHVVMARPTVSQVLYEQMVGRGLRGPKFGGTEHCTIIDFQDRYRGQRPQLGYEAFREVWHPRPEEMYAGSNVLGMLVQWGMGEPLRCNRRHGQAEVSSKVAQRRIRLPLNVRIEGPGEARLTIEAVEAQADQPAFHRVIELGPEVSEMSVSVEILPGQKLRLESVTSDPRAYVDVRRVHRPAPKSGLGRVDSTTVSK